MAKSVNKVILLGNVGKDPEIRSTPGGMIVANLSLATASRFQGQNGEWQERTEWHNLVAFKRTAEIVRDYVKKGAKLYIEGSLRTSSWDDRQSGEKKFRTEIVVNDISLLSGRGEEPGESGNDRSSPEPARTNTARPVNNEPEQYSSLIPDEDIPF